MGQTKITLDGSFGPSRALTGSEHVIEAEVGKIKGNNLFHSFGQFNVGSKDTVEFRGPSSINNIVTRVTGGALSSIDGTIKSQASMPHANFFLLNPKGVMLGPNAKLEVGGAFHASTADYLRFADDAKYFADLSKRSKFTVAKPVAFGFLTMAATSISIDRSNLTVPEGKALSIVAGGIRSTGAELRAPSGRILIEGMGAGEASLKNLADGSKSSHGKIEISGTTLDTSGKPGGTVGKPGGTVLIRGGQLLIDGSSILAKTTSDTNGARVGIDLRASGQLTISKSAMVTTDASGAGRGGDIVMTGARINLSAQVSIKSTTSGAGAGGDIHLDAGDLTFEGAALASETSGAGPGGNIHINVENMTLNPPSGRAVATVATATSAAGRGGAIVVTAGGTIHLATRATVASSASDAGQGGAIRFTARHINFDRGTLTSKTSGDGSGGNVKMIAESLSLGQGSTIQAISESGNGKGGAVTLRVGTLGLTGGSSIATYTNSDGIGAAGNLTVSTTGDALIADVGSGLLSASDSDAAAGDITARFKSLTLTRGGQIQAGSVTGTRGGNLVVTATDSISISDRAGISSQASTEDVGSITIRTPRLDIDNGFVSSSTLEFSRAGNISLKVGKLSLRNGGQIASSNVFEAEGGGGNVHVVATESVAILGASSTGKSPLPEPFTSFFEDPASGIFSTASSENPDVGPAGSIRIVTPELSLTHGGKLSVATIGPGNAGGITINANTLNLTDGGRIDSGTTGAGRGGTITLGVHDLLSIKAGAGLFSNAREAGPGGDINVAAKHIELLGNSTISASSTGTAKALAGNVNIVFGDTLRMDHSSIATQS